MPSAKTIYWNNHAMSDDSSKTAIVTDSKVLPCFKCWDPWEVFYYTAFNKSTNLVASISSLIH